MNTAARYFAFDFFGFPATGGTSREGARSK
jgi:hypothetical protein